MDGRDEAPREPGPDGHAEGPRGGAAWRSGVLAAAAVGVTALIAATLILSGLPSPRNPAGASGPDGSPSVTPGATRAPEPSSSADASATAPPSPPGSATAEDDLLLVDRAELMALPASGAAWDRMLAAAEGDWPEARLDDRDSDALPHVLAAAFVHARTGDPGMRDRVVEALRSLEEAPAPRDLLAVARQLGGWVLAADLVGHREPSFVAWLHDLRYRAIGDHPRWQTLYSTAGETANNYGTFALASLIAADRFLGDELGLERDWRIFRGYGEPFGWPFVKTEDWDEAYSCVATDPDRPDALPVAINPAGCEVDGVDLGGMPVEDASRAGDAPRPHPGYVNEAMQGYATQALLLEAAGYDAWAANDRQVLRVAELQERAGVWNAHPTGYYVAWIVNHAYGLDLPAEPDTAGGRMLAWTDWLFP
jgi:hypothetical protein